MNSTFTRAELREAVKALDIIEERGRDDDFQFVITEALRELPAGATGENMTGRERLNGGAMADRLVTLLGAPREECLAAVVEVMGRSRERTKYAAILRYAAELRRKTQ